jgi:hypothetical protein
MNIFGHWKLMEILSTFFCHNFSQGIATNVKVWQKEWVVKMFVELSTLPQVWQS